MTKKLQGGYTTGACAAAGVMAALLFLRGESPAQVKLSALDGTVLVIPVRRVQATEDGAEAETEVTDLKGKTVLTARAVRRGGAIRVHTEGENRNIRIRSLEEELEVIIE